MLRVNSNMASTPHLHHIYPDESNISSTNFTFDKQNGRFQKEGGVEPALFSRQGPYSSSFLHSNVTEETFENRLHPGEGKFHDILEKFTYRTVYNQSLSFIIITIFHHFYVYICICICVLRSYIRMR